MCLQELTIITLCCPRCHFYIGTVPCCIFIGTVSRSLLPKCNIVFLWHIFTEPLSVCVKSYTYGPILRNCCLFSFKVMHSQLRSCSLCLLSVEVSGEFLARLRSSASVLACPVMYWSVVKHCLWVQRWVWEFLNQITESCS